VFDHAIALCAAADGFSESLRGRDEEGKQKGGAVVGTAFELSVV
jgi:hypothetical protein